MRHLLSKVIYNRNISPSYYKIGLACEELSTLAIPGQFVMVRVSHQCYPLLGRPFSIYSAMMDHRGIEILYKVVGRGTSILSEKRPGDSIPIVGPLGKGFYIDGKWKDIIIIAGGIGVAPFYYLTEWIIGRAFSKITLFVGGKGRDDIICVDEFQGMGVEIKVATEDGSLGKEGLITELLEEELLERERPPSVIYTCGPMSMLREVAAIAEKEGIPCQVSLDRVMACGIGTCLGCVVKTEDRSQESKVKNCKGENRGWTYKRVCKEGPVFDAKEVVWEKQ